jgi:hypothetical protein
VILIDAVIRQTAATLVHHGVRCAHLYLSQSQKELPGVLNTISAAHELRAAYQQVRLRIAFGVHGLATSARFCSPLLMPKVDHQFVRGVAICTYLRTSRCFFMPCRWRLGGWRTRPSIQPSSGCWGASPLSLQ